MSILYETKSRSSSTGLEIITSEQGAFIEGLNRRMPLNDSHNYSVQKMYRLGFIEGIKSDFNFNVSPVEIPYDENTYDAFLSGLAATDCPGLSGETTIPIYDRPPRDRSYDLGLKLLLLHLGCKAEEIESRRIYIRMNPKLLEYYRKEAEKLRSETATNRPL